MTIAPSRSKLCSAWLRVFGAWTSTKGHVVGQYYVTFFYHDLSSRQHTQKPYGDENLQVNVARFTKYGLQLKEQERRFDRIAERLGNGKSLCCVPAFFCLCARNNDYRDPKENSESALHKKTLAYLSLSRCDVSAEDDFFRWLPTGSLSCLFANEQNNLSIHLVELYIDYGKVYFTTFVQFGDL